MPNLVDQGHQIDHLVQDTLQIVRWKRRSRGMYVLEQVDSSIQ
jgi:hypothetical protein